MMVRTIAAVSLTGLLASLLSGCREQVPQNPLVGVGGYALVYEQQDKRRIEPSEIASALRERINARSSSEVVVRALDDGRCEILLPGASEKTVAEVKRAIALSNLMQFRLVADPHLNRRQIDQCADGNSTDEARWCQYAPDKVTLPPETPVGKSPQGTETVLVVESPDQVDAWHFKHANLGQDADGRPCIMATLNQEGAARMLKFSSNNRSRQLAIIFDDVVISAPTIQAAIRDRLQITGNFNKEELQFIVKSLGSARALGSLNPTPIAEEKVSADSGGQ